MGIAALGIEHGVDGFHTDFDRPVKVHQFLGGVGPAIESNLQCPIVGGSSLECVAQFAADIEFHILHAGVFLSQFELSISHVGQFPTEADVGSGFEAELQFLKATFKQLVVSSAPWVRENRRGAVVAGEVFAQTEETIEHGGVDFGQ